MMQRVLYIDDSSSAGVNRFLEFERLLGRDIAIQFVGLPVFYPATFTLPNRWDLVVADVRGLTETHQGFVEQVVETSPDAVLVLIAETLGQSAADAMLNHGAIDCVSVQGGYDLAAKSVRRTLSRLALARGAIKSMNSRIEQFDMTLAIGVSPNGPDSLAKHTLRHLAQMDVCGLREQFRAIRAFEEALEKLHQYELAKLAESAEAASEGRPVNDSSASAGKVKPMVADPTARVRIHLSADGLRFALRSSDAAIEKLPGRESAIRDGFADANDLWFAPPFMDKITVNESGHELSMLKLPDDVCKSVSQAIAHRRVAHDPKHDLLSDVLKVCDGQDTR